MARIFDWSNTPEFAASRHAIEDDVSEWDLFQWAIEETICAEHGLDNTHRVSETSDLRYFKTWEHPGTAALPRLVVVFRIARPPAPDGTPGLLEGHRIVKLGELNGGDVAGKGPVLPWA